MKRKINKRDAAKRAMIEIADYLANDSILLAANFIDAVERTLDFLATMPEIGAHWESDHPHLKDIRVWSVDGFPDHLIFYRPTNEYIDLVFVCHSHRDLNELLANLNK